MMVLFYGWVILYQNQVLLLKFKIYRFDFLTIHSLFHCFFFKLAARAVVNGNPYSVRTNFTKNRLCDGIWHCVQIRLDGSSLSMKVDKRVYSKTEARASLVDMRGPLFVGGYSEKYFPPFLSVRTKDFFHGNLRNIKINEKQIDYLAPRHSNAIPEFYHFNSPPVVNHTCETTIND